MKEGLQNSHRYKVTKFVENEDGTIVEKLVGYCLAVNISDNRNNSNGYSESSTFYQISGRKMEEGMKVKQHSTNPAEISLSTLPDFIIKHEKFNLDFSYEGILQVWHTLGTTLYTGCNIGFLNGTIENADEYIVADQNDWSSWFNLGITMGIGFHPVRWIELRPYIGLGFDIYNNYNSNKNKSNYNISEVLEDSRFFLRYGARFSWQFSYPWKIFTFVDRRYSGKSWCGNNYISPKHSLFEKLNWGVGISCSL